MKKKILIFIAITFLLSTPIAFASQERLTSSARLAIATENSQTETALPQLDDRAEADRVPNEEASSSRKMHEILIAQSHRSAVTSLVASLLAVADHNESIGAEVRAIAEEQRNAEATTTGAMQEVAFRSTLKTILFGSDHKNLNVLRDEMQRTRADMGRLSAVLGNTSDAIDRATIAAQIHALEVDQESIHDFIKNNESILSIFGWLTGLFATS